MVRDEAKAAGQQMINTPGEIAQAAADNMWAAILGTDVKNPVQLRGAEKMPEQDSFTRLNMDKLNAAYARQDMAAAERINERLQDHQQEKAENSARHKEYAAVVERAIQELKMEDEERKKKELEEEQMKKQQEEEEKARQQASIGDAGAGKSKARMGQARKKASTDTNFESSAGKTGK